MKKKIRWEYIFTLYPVRSRFHGIEALEAGGAGVFYVDSIILKYK